MRSQTLMIRFSLNFGMFKIRVIKTKKNKIGQANKKKTIKHKRI